MAKRTSPTQKRTPKRQYFGQSVAEPLINWLNSTNDKVGRDRIIDLLRAYTEAAVAAEPLSKLFVGKDGYTYEEQTPATKRRDELENALNKLLSFYATVPQIAWGTKTVETGTPRRLTIYQLATPGSEIARHSVKGIRLDMVGKELKRNEGPAMMMGEIGAVSSILNLIDMGLISKLIRCRCGKFFFIRFEHQRFCSEKCRVNDLRSNPEARKKRNEYARKLYHLHKSGKVK
jgi:hypothetical protein